MVKPKDLEGKKLGAPAPDGAYAQWKIFTQANGIDASKVTIENVGFPVREPMLAAGQVDAITGFSFSSFINLKDRGVPVDDITVLLMADYGVNLYGNAIIVNPKFAAEKPEVVKKFLTAFLKGLKETVKNPDASVASVLKRNDVAKKEVELERLKMALKDNILTPEVKANGFGGVDTARLDKSIEQIALTYEFKNAEAERRAMSSTPRSCRRPPIARRIEALEGSAETAIGARLHCTRRRQPSLWRHPGGT